LGEGGLAVISLYEEKNCVVSLDTTQVSKRSLKICCICYIFLHLHNFFSDGGGWGGGVKGEERTGGQEDELIKKERIIEREKERK
jgi:hypothetical protein